jgi:hypothetical protein
MIPIRTSTALRPNDRLEREETKRTLSNGEWLQEIDAREGVILLGGATISHFRVRYAQSGARSDLTPSHWSLAGVLLDRDRFLSVPLEGWRDASAVPAANGIRECRVDEYDDPDTFPNIAILSFGVDAEQVVGIARQLMLQRSVVDLPEMIVPWLAYVWDAGQPTNPLANSVGVPSAAFVEVAYGVAGVELTPGLSSASSCPEAIWQSAKWWHEFYEEAARRPAGAGLSESEAGGAVAGAVPSGHSLVRQPVAAPSAGSGATGTRPAARPPDARTAAMQAAGLDVSRHGRERARPRKGRPR